MHLPSALASATRRALAPLALVVSIAGVALLLVVPAHRASATIVYTSLSALTQAAGDPPGTNFARLRIPSLAVDAPVGQAAVADGAAMPLPQGPADVMWYDLSDWYALGGTAPERQL